MIRNLLFFTIIFATLVSCSKKGREHYLVNGFDGYQKQRYIGENFIKDYGVQKIAFFERSDTLSYALLLEDNVETQTVENYSLGLYIYPTDQELLKEREFLIWDSKPYLKQVGAYKYIISDFRLPIKRIDSLVFFLYDRDQFKGVEGNVIRLKNLSI